MGFTGFTGVGSGEVFHEIMAKQEEQILINGYNSQWLVVINGY